MTELIKFVYQELSAVGTTYLEKALQGQSFPYITMTFPNSQELDPREDFILEVNVWDYSTDTTTLEGLTTQIEDRLHYKKHISTSDKIVTYIYRVNRLMIPDPDVNIRRRMIRFTCKTYFIQ